MDNSMLVNTPLTSYSNLSSKLCLKSGKEKEEMQKIPYSSTCDSLMYVIMCTRPVIAHVIGVVNSFLTI